MAAAAVPLLSERMTIWRTDGLALGFVGVVVLVWPQLCAVCRTAWAPLSKSSQG